MAFKLYSTNDGHVPAWEYLPCSAITPVCGTGMAYSSGNLAVSKLPTHICMMTAESPVVAGTLIPCVRIDNDQVWETLLDAENSCKVGDVMDVTASGLYVDADATTNKNFELTHVAGNAMGDVCRGRFVK